MGSSFSQTLYFVIMLARRSEFKNVFSQLFTFSKPRLSSNHSLSAILNCRTNGSIEISNKDIYNSLTLISEYMKKNIFIPNNINFPNSRKIFINQFK